eukprot:63949-Hanusia_phi.AAC.1
MFIPPSSLPPLVVSPCLSLPPPCLLLHFQHVHLVSPVQHPQPPPAPRSLSPPLPPSSSASGAARTITEDDIASCDQGLLPGVGWERIYLRYFTRLHELVEGRREERRRSGSKSCPPLVSGSEGWANKVEEEEGTPSLRQMLSLEARALLRMLWSFADYLEGMEEEERRRVLRSRGGAWLFAMLVCVERPCDADTMAAMRRIVRSLCSMRSSMRAEDADLRPVNVLITIIGTFYGQLPVRPEVYEEGEEEWEEWEEGGEEEGG